MPHDNKKLKRDTTLIASNYLDKVKETLKRFSEQKEQMLNDVRPTLERVVEERQNLTIHEVNQHAVTSHQPTDILILKELKKLNEKHVSQKSLSETDIVLIYDTTDNSLNRTIGGKTFSYDLSEDGKRKKLLDILTAQNAYVKTDELKDLLKCPTNQAVAKVVQTFNDYAANALRLKKVKIIQGKKGSGYRLNPRIHIEKE